MENSNGKQYAKVIFSDRSRYGAINDNKNRHEDERPDHYIIIVTHLFLEESGAKTYFLISP